MGLYLYLAFSQIFILLRFIICKIWTKGILFLLKNVYLAQGHSTQRAYDRMHRPHQHSRKVSMKTSQTPPKRQAHTNSINLIVPCYTLKHLVYINEKTSRFF